MASGRHRVGASPLSVIVLFLLSFAAGAAAGAIGYHQYTCKCKDEVWSRKGASWKEDQVAHWTHELELDPGQRAHLEAALDSVSGRYRALYADMAPRKREIDAELHAKVRSVLDERQRARYEAALAEADARRAAYYGTIDPKSVAAPIQPASATAIAPAGRSAQ
jgi:hypothetical protein